MQLLLPVLLAAAVLMAALPMCQNLPIKPLLLQIWVLGLINDQPDPFVDIVLAILLEGGQILTHRPLYFISL